MDDKTLVKAAAVVILAPVVIGVTVTVINGGIAIYNAIKLKQFNKKIKKGLEDGSIVENDGHYYELKNVDETTEEA